MEQLLDFLLTWISENPIESALWCAGITTYTLWAAAYWDIDE